MTKPALLALLAACATASATPAPNKATPAPPPPPPPSNKNAPQQEACKATGDVLFEIDHQVTANVKDTTSVTKIYATGAWTYAETTPEGKRGREASGCLDKTDLAKVKAAVDAPWTVSHPQIHCMAMSTKFVVYTAKGHAAFTQKVCGTDILDEKTAAAVAEVDKLSDGAMAVKDPPCCKK